MNRYCKNIEFLCVSNTKRKKNFYGNFFKCCEEQNGKEKEKKEHGRKKMNEYIYCIILL